MKMIDDIIAEMRKDIPRVVDAKVILRNYADRIEAAIKREREAVGKEEDAEIREGILKSIAECDTSITGWSVKPTDDKAIKQIMIPLSVYEMLVASFREVCRAKLVLQNLGNDESLNYTTACAKKCPRCKTGNYMCEYYSANGDCHAICYPTNPPQYDKCVYLGECLLHKLSVHANDECNLFKTKGEAE